MLENFAAGDNVCATCERFELVVVYVVEVRAIETPLRDLCAGNLQGARFHVDTDERCSVQDSKALQQRAAAASKIDDDRARARGRFDFSYDQAPAMQLRRILRIRDGVLVPDPLVRVL